jgi:predicted HTH transcriptional regulator
VTYRAVEGGGINRIISACKDQGLEAPRIAEKNYFFDVEIMRPPAVQKQPELQPESKQESLFSKILGDMLDKPKSGKEISCQLNQKSISGQLNEVLGKFYERCTDCVT